MLMDRLLLSIEETMPRMALTERRVHAFRDRLGRLDKKLEDRPFGEWLPACRDELEAVCDAASALDQALDSLREAVESSLFDAMIQRYRERIIVTLTSLRDSARSATETSVGAAEMDARLLVTRVECCHMLDRLEGFLRSMQDTIDRSTICVYAPPSFFDREEDGGPPPVF